MQVGEWRLWFLGSHSTHLAIDSHVGPHVALPAKSGTALGAQVHFGGAQVLLLFVGIQRALALKDLVALIAQHAIIMLIPKVGAMRHFE